jgi:hypothetical protein
VRGNQKEIDIERSAQTMPASISEKTVRRFPAVKAAFIQAAE